MDSLSDSNWPHWERRRSHKLNPLNYLYITLLNLFAFFPILQNTLLWNEYDEVIRSFYPRLDSWTAFFSGSIFWNENPLALATYFIESLIPLPEAITHRLINILLHSSAAILLYRLLNRMHVSGAFLVALVFTVHPVTVQTLFWPGYRSIIITLCLLLWCLYLALDRKNKKNPNLPFVLSALVALIQPVALLIPLTLFLNQFVKNKEFKFRNFTRVVPYLMITLILCIISAIFKDPTINQFDSVATESKAHTPSFIYQFFGYFKIISYPFGNAFFNPINHHSSFSILYLLPYPVLFLTCLFLYFKRNTIWGRLLIMGITLFLALLIYASGQNGRFLDGTYALDDSLVYIAIIPAIALLISTINAFVVHKAPKLKILWFSLVGILVLISTSISFSRSLLYSKPLKTWEYFDTVCSDSITPKKALSDYVKEYGYSKYSIKDHIQFLEFIVQKSPNYSVEKIKLARLYIENKQNEEAQKLYQSIVADDKIRDEKVLEEVANFFELQGLYIDARETRDLLNEVVQ